MATHPPFMNSTSRIKSILDKVITAQKPPRFTYDFLETKLGAKGGSAKPIVALLKRLQFLNTDGTPTELYSKFRSDSSRGAAMAKGLKIGYTDVYERNEYAHELPKDKFKDLIIEITGLEKGSSTVEAIVGTFFKLKEYAKFDQEDDDDQQEDVKAAIEHQELKEMPSFSQTHPQATGGKNLGLNLAYTINLNLPETTDIEVFNAIFKSLKENLMTEES